MQFPEDSAAEKSAANYCFLLNVASARNACRKFSTGMIRKSPACRRASAAFSPAGTRKTSAPERRAPITFCFTPPIGSTLAVELDLARRRHVQTAVDVAAQLLDDVEREREPRRGPADAGQVDLRRRRQLDVGELLDLDPDDRPPFSVGLAIVPTLDHLRGAVAPDAQAGPSRPPCASRSAGAGRPACCTASPSTPTITSVGWIFPVAGTSGATADDLRALRLGLDVVAELAQRDRGCDLLRAAHRLQVLAAALAEVRPGRHERLLGDEVGAVGPRRRGELSRAARPRARPRRRSRSRRAGAASRPRPRPCRRAAWPCRAGAGSCSRAEPERADGQRAEDQPADDQPAELHCVPLVRPPSTPIAAPVTYEARSEARKQTTSPISRGVPRRPSGIVARSASVGPSG